jgi:hypothetical protein
MFNLNIAGIAAATELLEALEVTVEEETAEVYIAAPTVNYAVYQELGTSSIDARPYMRPAAEKVNANISLMLETYGAAAPDAGPAETLAIAVQNEAKKIADQKGVRDTGALINSITYEQVE